MAEVITVNGAIGPNELGVTMSHVHVLSHTDRKSAQRSPAELMTPSEREIYEGPLTMDKLGMVRRNNFSVKENEILGDLEDATDELMFYKRLGGASLIECTPVGIGRDPAGLKKVAGATGLNIVVNTGAYVGATHSPFIQECSLEELSQLFVRELTVEIGNSGIRAGVIKAALSSPNPETPFQGAEEKVLRAGGRAQAETGAAMTMHPCHHFGKAKHHHTYLDILESEGANLEKIYFSHMDFWGDDFDYQESILDRGVYVAFDQCGNEENAPAYPKPHDESRVTAIANLAKAGYSDRVLLSNEVVRKIGLRKYGGYGYAHVLENIVPDLRYFGVTQDQIKTMLVENPKKLFPF